MEYARIAARHFKTNHHEHYITADDLVVSIPKVAASYDQPFGNSSALPAYYCAQMARADGIGKMLGGDGGDELFGGNTRYTKQKIFEWYGVLPGPLRTNLMEPIFGSRKFERSSAFSKASSYVQQASIPMPDRLRLYNLITRLGVEQVLTPDMLARIDLDEPLRQQREVWSQASSGDFVNRMLAYDWRYTLAENDLPKVCGTTNLAGVEVGFPLLDMRLVNFSMRLPPDYKVKGMKLRWFFKEALRGFLPQETITKKKQGFGLPFGVWATEHRGLRSLAENSLYSFGSRGIVRPEFIQSLLTERLATHPGYYGEMVWVLMMLEQWLRSHAPDYRCE